MVEAQLTIAQLPIWAEEYAESVVSAYDPDAIILFGSVARNAQKPHSDIDILVIGGNLPSNHRDRFRQLMRLRPPLAPIELQSFTRVEWEAMIKGKHVTVLEALKDGKALYGATLFSEWRQQFQRWIDRGLRRTDCTWVYDGEQKRR